MALMQINVIPLGTGSTSVGEFVAGITKALARDGVVYQLTDMGTLVEGEVAELFRVAALIHGIPFLKGAKRVVTQISIDDRRDKKVRIGDKITSVSSRLAVADGPRSGEVIKKR